MVCTMSEVRLDDCNVPSSFNIVKCDYWQCRCLSWMMLLSFQQELPRNFHVLFPRSRPGRRYGECSRQIQDRREANPRPQCGKGQQAGYGAMAVVVSHVVFLSMEAGAVISDRDACYAREPAKGGVIRQYS